MFVSGCLAVKSLKAVQAEVLLAAMLSMGPLIFLLDAFLG